MAQVTAGETITLQLEGGSVVVKVEDASKSDAILAKVLQSTSDAHPVDAVHRFDRQLLAK